jgi:hypothetical protein
LAALPGSRAGPSPFNQKNKEKRKENHDSINLPTRQNILWQDFFGILFHADVDGLVVVGAAPKVAPDRFHRVELQADDRVQHGLCACNVSAVRRNKKQQKQKKKTKTDEKRTNPSQRTDAKKIRLYLAVIAVKCDKGLEIVDVNALGQLIAIGFQVGPVRQSGGSVAWTKE